MKKIFPISILIFLIFLGLFSIVSAFEVPLPHIPPEAAREPAYYIKGLFLLGLALAGILAVGAIIFGGIQYSLSGGNPSKQSDAKDRIYQALLGLGLLLCTYLILYTINPDLVRLKLEVEKLEVEEELSPEEWSPQPSVLTCEQRGGSCYSDCPEGWDWVSGDCLDKYGKKTAKKCCQKAEYYCGTAFAEGECLDRCPPETHFRVGGKCPSGLMCCKVKKIANCESEQIGGKCELGGCITGEEFPQGRCPGGKICCVER